MGEADVSTDKTADQKAYEEAIAAAGRGDYATAMATWRTQAEQGNGAAQYNLAVLYDNGRGVPQDHVQAAAWYRKSAEQNFIWSQHALGSLYELGQGVAQDHQEALQWYGKAAENGFVKSLLALSGMFEQGLGVPGSRVMAYALSNLAAIHDMAEGSPAMVTRLRLVEPLSEPEFLAGQNLTEALRRPGQFMPTLLGYRDPA